MSNKRNAGSGTGESMGMSSTSMTRRRRRLASSIAALVSKRFSQASNWSGSRNPAETTGWAKVLWTTSLRKLAVPEDQAGGRVRGAMASTAKLGEGVMIAPPCPLDERPLVHGLPFERARPTWSR